MAVTPAFVTPTDPAVTRTWMRQQGYDYPALLEDRLPDGARRALASRVGVFGYPTTVFLDRQGRIAFWQLEPTPLLVEEYTWRVEALLRPAPDGDVSRGHEIDASAPPPRRTPR